MTFTVEYCWRFGTYVGTIEADSVFRAKVILQDQFSQSGRLYYARMYDEYDRLVASYSRLADVKEE